MWDVAQPRKDSSASSRSRGPWLLALAVAILPVLFLFGPAAQSRRSYECAVCRKERVDSRVLWFRWSEARENECSRWYQAHVEPAHTHVWAPRPHCQRFGIPGIYGGYGCSVGSRITGLSRRVQIDVYRHFAEPLEAKRFFVRLQQLDGTGESLRMWDSLMDWVDADYPGTWHDWWEMHRDVVEGGDEHPA